MTDGEREKLDATYGRANAAAAMANSVIITLAAGAPRFTGPPMESLDAACLQIEQDVKKNAAAEAALTYTKSLKL
jgi:hypothetical protein